MCFSAEASFTAALLLGTAGGLSLKRSNSLPQYFLAGIPLLFAFQQFSEGLIWLHLKKGFGDHELFINAERAFLTFAFFIWPIWIPLTFALLEKVLWRKSLLFINLYFGLALSILNLTYAIREDINVKVIHYSLQYLGHIPSQEILYPLIVMFPLFLSSLKKVWLYGLLVITSFVLADYFYRTTFASVWCFFSAIVSLFVYKILIDNSKEKSGSRELAL